MEGEAALSRKKYGPYMLVLVPFISVHQLPVYPVADMKS